MAATASLFTTLDAVALRPLPYSDSDQLFVVADRHPDDTSVTIGQVIDRTLQG